MNKTITSIVHKVLSLIKKVTLNPKGKKRALISYVLFPAPPFDFQFFFDISHNRYLCSYMMCEALKKKGYRIDIYDYQNTELDYSKKYDIFLGHNKTFYSIADKLNADCKKVLLTTGSSPDYDNKVLLERQSNVQQLKNTADSFFSPIVTTSWAENNFKVADYVFMIGNDATRKTWPFITKERVFFYNNLTNIVFKKKEGRNNNFLYLSSTGQLRRGLDIIIEVFKGREEKIYICGPYQEPAFMKHFADDLSKNPNIILKGFIDQTSADFFSIIADCTFGLLPSVSEGQSGSVLTMISYGLIPVITPQNGFENIEDYGIDIQHADVEGVKTGVNEALALSNEQLEQKRINLINENEKYTPEFFKRTFESFIDNITR